MEKIIKKKQSFVLSIDMQHERKIDDVVRSEEWEEYDEKRTVLNICLIFEILTLE